MVEKTVEKTVEVRTSLPDEIHKILKQEAVRRDLPLKEFTVKILTEYAKKLTEK